MSYTFVIVHIVPIVLNNHVMDMFKQSQITIVMVFVYWKVNL